MVCLVFFLSCIVICYYNGKASDKQLRHLLPYVSNDFEEITKDEAKDQEREDEKVALAKGLVSTMTIEGCDFGSVIGGEFGSVILGDNVAKPHKEDEKKENEIIEGFASVFLGGKPEADQTEESENNRRDEIIPSSGRQGKHGDQGEARTGKGADGENKDDEITKIEEENVMKDKLMKEKTKIKKIVEEEKEEEVGKEKEEERGETEETEEKEREENEFENDKKMENQSWKWKPKNSAKKRKIENKGETFEGEEEEEEEEKKKKEEEKVGKEVGMKEREKGKEYEVRNKEKGKEYDGKSKEEKGRDRQCLVCLHNSPASRKKGNEEKELGSSSWSAPNTPILGEKRNRKCKICDKCKKCQQERHEMKQEKEQQKEAI